MGDIADMILDGILDEHTGEYIGPGVGYPRTIERTQNQSNGVNNYLVKRELKTKGERTQVIKDYLHSINVKTGNMSKVKMCEIISEDFEAFNKYCQKLG